jgi:hypothetical protein
MATASSEMVRLSRYCMCDSDDVQYVSSFCANVCMYVWGELEASFGVASIQFLNDTTAEFSWHRHACNGANNSRVRLYMSRMYV